jgi:hypothetical protein
MLAVGDATTSFASSPPRACALAWMRVMAAGFPTGAAPGREPVYSPMVAFIAGRSRDPGSALSFFRSLGEAAAPCFRKRLDPRMCSKGAHKVTDMVADCFAAQVQRRRDLPSRLAAGEQFEHLLLPWRQG